MQSKGSFSALVSNRNIGSLSDTSLVIPVLLRSFQVSSSVLLIACRIQPDYSLIYKAIFKTSVTITNVTSSALSDVLFMRSFDPVTLSTGGSYRTTNKIDKTFAGDGAAMVSATSGSDVTQTWIPVNGLFLLRRFWARVYTGGFSGNNLTYRSGDDKK